MLLIDKRLKNDFKHNFHCEVRGIISSGIEIHPDF